MIFALPPMKYDLNDQTQLRAAVERELRAVTPQFGTYIPSISSSGGGETLTYSTQLGQWLRLGALVWFHAEVTLATKSGGSGEIQISLPAPASAGTAPSVALYLNNMAAGWTGSAVANINAGTAIIRVREYAAGVTAASWTKLGSTGGFRATGVYLAP